jgi:hypothetical protein
MSAHFQSSGPRGNAYSESKFTNWTEFHPFHAEGRAAYKRFDQRLPARPAFPRIIRLPPFKPDFFHPVDPSQVKWRLSCMPASHLEGLRAVFILGGTRKQQRSWYGSLRCYGFYWRECVFLCAYPNGLMRHDRDWLRDFFLDDVLVHEVAHHLDRFRDANYSTKEAFAYGFVERHGA